MRVSGRLVICLVNHLCEADRLHRLLERRDGGQLVWTLVSEASALVLLQYA